MVFKSARLQGSSFYFLELQMWGAVDDGKTGGENVYFCGVGYIDRYHY
jgi:hypothetical protein